MTPSQLQTIDALKAESFKVIRNHRDMVLVSRGADHRIVRHDGSQRRAQAHFQKGQ